MENILVSVIVPIYNVRPYLEQCLNSLERQTLKDIEVILINDGSTDGSDAIAGRYADKNDNFRLISRPNGGASAARNTGLDTACGEFVYFMDSDDILEHEALERLYNISEQEQLDMIRFAAYSFEDGTDDYLWQKDNGYMYSGDYPAVSSGLEFYQRSIDSNDYYPSCCMFFSRRSVIEKNRLRFVEGIVCEDNLFMFQLTVLCSRVKVLNEPLYYRRFRNGSVMQTLDWLNRDRSLCIIAEKADEFIDAHPEINVGTVKWQILFFIKLMVLYWEKMTWSDQKSREAAEYFHRVSPLIKKYGNGGSISLLLLRVGYPAFVLYKRCAAFAGGMLRKK